MYPQAMKARMSDLEQQKAEIDKRLEDSICFSRKPLATISAFDASRALPPQAAMV
jgi:hypothetical protein